MHYVAREVDSPIDTIQATRAGPRTGPVHSAETRPPQNRVLNKGVV